jgi:hypothetical protein
MIEDLDRTVNILSESAARTLTRRRVLRTAVKGLVAATAGLALTLGPDLREAFAQTCTCNWIGGSSNADCPKVGYCSDDSCPSGCSLCTSGGGCCEYPSGSWVSCTGLGRCGAGYRLCIDCKCSTCSGYLCTCLTDFYCCNCCTPSEVEAEMQRIAARRAA